MTQPGIYFKQLELGPMQNFVYLIGDAARHEAAVVDPGWEVPHILETLRRDGYRLTAAFVTHHHFDHVMGLGELLKAADVPVVVHRHDAPYLKITPSSLKPVDGGETLTIGEIPVRLLHTPGHTPGSQCLLVDGRLLSGDTLFVRACGRWDLPGGDVRQLFESLRHRLGVLDDDTVLCPGHHYAQELTTTLGEEKRTNPFLRPTTVEEFLRIAGMGA